MKKIFMMIAVTFLSLAFAVEPKANVKKVLDVYSSGNEQKAISIAKVEKKKKNDYMNYMVNVFEETKKIVKDMYEEYGSDLSDTESAEYERAVKEMEKKYSYLEKDMAYYEVAGELMESLLEEGVLSYTDIYSLLGPVMEMADLMKNFEM